MFADRVLSGMRPTGSLHLGHYHGVLKNWVQMQHEFECLFFVADWHALTTHYDNPQVIEQSVWDMVVDWLAAGVDPQSATLFIQSQVPAHAELFTLLSMMTPLSWLERVPTYKDQQLRLKDKDLSTYGILGYPLLQSADILIYRAGFVPVGEDQVAHVEITREVARRFNHLYGREPGYEEQCRAAIKETRGKAKYLGGVGTKVTGITRRTIEPNLQRVKAIVDGEVRYIRVAASAIKKGLVVKAPRRTWKKEAAAVEK